MPIISDTAAGFAVVLSGSDAAAVLASLKNAHNVLDQLINPNMGTDAGFIFLQAIEADTNVRSAMQMLAKATGATP